VLIFKGLCAMNKYAILLIIAVLIFTSCKDDDEGLPLTPDLVTSIRAFDLDNNGNSSDIRVDFNVRDNNNVTEYRIMVVSSNNSNSFDVGNAASLPESNYLEVNPVTFDNEYSESRLPSSLLDVNGDQIINGVEYVVAIFVFGTGTHQLSEFSRPLTLLNQGIYVGEYTGVYIQDIINPSAPACNTLVFNRPMEITMRETGTENYSGTLICPPCREIYRDIGSVRITIADNIISEFIYNQVIPCYCGLCVFEVDPCNAVFTGQGIIQDEVNFEISFSGDDCAGFSENTLTLFRQN